MKTHLQQTNHNTYKYVRRVPKELLKYTTATTFRVSLGSNQLEATRIALSFNNAIEEALQLAKLTVDDEMIIAKLDGLIPKRKSHSKPMEPPEQGLFGNLATEYLGSQSDNISAEETRDKKYFYKQVCTSLFEHIGITSNPKVDSISFNRLLEFRSIITQLPKRNIQKYRTAELSAILQNLHKVEAQDRISARTINKYIKWLRALFSFAVVLGQAQVNLANSIPLQKSLDDRLQRLPLDESELVMLLEEVPTDMRSLLKILANTGMRLSELYKCELVEVEGIKCFSLMDRAIKLKTKSSYRIIPIHSALGAELEEFEAKRNRTSSDNLARTTSGMSPIN